MTDILDHEKRFRGEATVTKFGATRVTICGAGALGSNLAETLVRQGISQIVVLDKDRVEKHNISTQVYGLDDVGKLKTDALRDRLYNLTGIEISSVPKELEQGNVKKYVRCPQSPTAHLVVDCFDNTAARQLLQNECRRQAVPCLHAGLHEGYGEVIWDERYTVPQDGGVDLCDYPLARNVIMLTATIAAESIVSYLAKGRQRSFRLTLADCKITELS